MTSFFGMSISQTSYASAPSTGVQRSRPAPPPGIGSGAGAAGGVMSNANGALHADALLRNIARTRAYRLLLVHGSVLRGAATGVFRLLTADTMPFSRNAEQVASWN